MKNRITIVKFYFNLFVLSTFTQVNHKLLIFLFWTNTLFAQNLIPNPSFEDFEYCPTNFGQLTNNCASWEKYDCSPDYYNCGSNNYGANIHCFPSHGSGSVGILGKINSNCLNQEYVENIRAQLLQPLQKDSTYQFHFDLRLDTFATTFDTQSTCLDIGIYFYNNSLSPFSNQCGCKNLTPVAKINSSQTTFGFQNYTLEYTADNPYDSLIFGVFCPNSPENYCYNLNSFKDQYFNIDNLSLVKKCYSKPISNFSIDSLVCIHDSITITNLTIQNSAYQSWKISYSENEFDYHYQPKKLIFDSVGIYTLKLVNKNACGIDSIEKTIRVGNIDSLHLQDTILCKDNPLTLDYSYPNDAVYIWNDGDTNSTKKFENDGVYKLSIENKYNCNTNDSFSISYAEYPSINLPQDTLTCNDSLTIILYQKLSNTYINDIKFDSTITFHTTGNYTFSMKNPCGEVQKEVVINIPDCELIIPNIITPNQDQINDFFSIKNIQYDDWSLIIYNRWGKEVYSDQNYKNDWNANDMLDGVYLYKLVREKDNKRYSGWIQILR